MTRWEGGLSPWQPRIRHHPPASCPPAGTFRPGSHARCLPRPHLHASQALPAASSTSAAAIHLLPSIGGLGRKPHHGCAAGQRRVAKACSPTRRHPGELNEAQIEECLDR